MSVLRSKRTGRHRTATVRSIILRPSLFSKRYSSDGRSLLTGHLSQWALFHEVLDRQACRIERSSHLRRVAPEKLSRPSMRRVVHKVTTEFRRWTGAREEA